MLQLKPRGEPESREDDRRHEAREAPRAQTFEHVARAPGGHDREADERQVHEAIGSRLLSHLDEPERGNEHPRYQSQPTARYGRARAWRATKMHTTASNAAGRGRRGRMWETGSGNLATTLLTTR